MFFNHLHDIDVHEVSLVDRGMIDENFIERKRAATIEEKRTKAALAWKMISVRDALSNGRISVEVLAEKSGIDSTAIESFKTGKLGDRVTVERLFRGLEAAGDKEVPKNGGVKMTKEEIKALLEGLLKPVLEKIGFLEKAVKEAGEGTKASSDEVKTSLAKLTEDVKGLRDDVDNSVDQTIKRFENVEKHLEGKTQKIEGQGEGDGKGGKEKKAKWPSFKNLSPV